MSSKMTINFEYEVEIKTDMNIKHLANNLDV